MGGSQPIVIEGLDHYYGKGNLRRQVLFDITTGVSQGEIIIVTGPSGSGKTTLLTLVGALRSAHSGSIRVLDEELNGARGDLLEKVRRRIGFIFQQHNLLGALTAAQNVELGLRVSRRHGRAELRRRAEAMLEAVGLGAHGGKLPEQMSGGQRQRVAIARALVGEPAMVLADEPTASLDRAAGREVVDRMQVLAREHGTTILLVTHDNRILDIADRIITLEDGRLTSFAAGVAKNTQQMMGALAQLQRRGELVRDLRELPAERFAEVLGEVTGEFLHLLGAMDVMGQELGEALVTEVLEAVTARVRELLQADRGTLFLVDRERGVLRSKIAHHLGSRPLTIEVPLDRGLAGHVANTGETLNIPDAYEDARFNPSTDRETGYRTRSVLCLPIRDREGTVFAVAQMLNRQGADRFTTADERAFGDFAAPLGVILEACMRLASRSTTTP
jgi:putative ABC transport system ATP-binding protein